jgi:hypothetical protein
MGTSANCLLMLALFSAIAKDLKEGAYALWTSYMSYPFTSWNIKYERDVMRLRRCRGWVGPLPTIGCPLKELPFPFRGQEDMKELGEAGVIPWRQSWRGPRFKNIEGRILKSALSQSGLSRVMKTRILAGIYNRPAPVRVPMRYPPVSTKQQEYNDLGTRQIHGRGVRPDEIRLKDTNHWHWLIERVKDQEVGSVVAFDVPPDLTAQRMSAMVRAILMGSRHTYLSRWSVRRSYDDQTILVSKTGSWGNEGLSMIG